MPSEKKEIKRSSQIYLERELQIQTNRDKEKTAKLVSESD